MFEEPHRARKRFGQNFLHDQNVIERILRLINPRAGDTLVEIGPGLGALTKPLLERAGRLQVVEIDRDVIPRLIETCGNNPDLVVTQGDALDIDFGALAPAGGQLRLVGNLPYNISTPLLFHLLKFSAQVRDMHFMLQKEVVDRICAGPGEDDYGRLSVTLGARCEAASLLHVGPGAFRPAPQVDSAVVRLTPRPPPAPIEDWALFDRLVTAAFSMRRKTLSNGLKGILTADEIRATGIDPGIRAERLGIVEFAKLANFAHSKLS